MNSAYSAPSDSMLLVSVQALARIAGLERGRAHAVGGAQRHHARLVGPVPGVPDLRLGITAAVPMRYLPPMYRSVSPLPLRSCATMAATAPWS